MIDHNMMNTDINNFQLNKEWVFNRAYFTDGRPVQLKGKHDGEVVDGYYLIKRLDNPQFIRFSNHEREIDLHVSRLLEGRCELTLKILD